MPCLLGNEERKRASYNNDGAGGARLTKKIFFLHVPSPPSMIFKEMECGPDILEGMLNANAVGFHGFMDARHFLSSTHRFLGVAHESFKGGLTGTKCKKRIVAVTMSSVSIEPPLVSGERCAFFSLSLILSYGLVCIRILFVRVHLCSITHACFFTKAAVQLQTMINGETALRTMHANRMIIVGLDCAQYLSGVVPKLSAYKRLLCDSL
jgi:trehalose 6-phosphate synthase/phosphatase